MVLYTSFLIIFYHWQGNRTPLSSLRHYCKFFDSFLSLERDSYAIVKFYVLWLWRCSRKLAESIAWSIIQKMRVDYIVSSTCYDWDCWVSHLWTTARAIRVLLGIWREGVWTTKDTGSWCSTKGYFSLMVGDTQTDDPWLGVVPQIDDGLFWWCRGLSWWEIW